MLNANYVCISTPVATPIFDHIKLELAMYAYRNAKIYTCIMKFLKQVHAIKMLKIWVSISFLL